MPLEFHGVAEPLVGADAHIGVCGPIEFQLLDLAVVVDVAIDIPRNCLPCGIWPQFSAVYATAELLTPSNIIANSSRNRCTTVNSYTSLATAIDSLKAFDRHNFDLPRELQRNHGEHRNEDAMVDVRCGSGPQFRAWYVNDWGHFYITRFEADRQVINQYERMQKKGQGKTAM